MFFVTVMEIIKDSDRNRRIRELESLLRDPRGVLNVDGLLVSYLSCIKMHILFSHRLILPFYNQVLIIIVLALEMICG